MTLPSWLRRKILFFEDTVDHELLQSRLALQRHLKREDELRRRIQALEADQEAHPHGYFVSHNRRSTDPI